MALFHSTLRYYMTESDALCPVRGVNKDNAFVKEPI